MQETASGRIQIYPLDSRGKFTPGTDAECGSDKEACELAQRMIAKDQDAEVWSGTRLVRRVSGASATTFKTVLVQVVSASWLLQWTVPLTSRSDSDALLAMVGRLLSD